jgi:hypothetical protein
MALSMPTRSDWTVVAEWLLCLPGGGDGERSERRLGAETRREGLERREPRSVLASGDERDNQSSRQAVG